MIIFKYLQFLPLLFKLIDFVRQAEALFKQPSSGQSKLDFVTGKIVPLVEDAASVGLIPQKLADAITTGAAAIISLIVQIMNATGGVHPAVPAAPPTLGDDPTLIEYPTLDEAKAHITPQMPLVIKRADGKFSIYPVIGIPSGAEQVYP